ncbi:ATP-binding protein [Streptomyces niveiscabiei]|uniref:ATP-binding protein n=1 Tax=Streptomyces niveiscabiei TaxID=164115 RepID=UPI0029A92AB3|nr:ATP-binding protein [Streptomyces niveiscabiei]MDX3385402.1 ATP-binding protein [Streptomyces niveiscabiei]
MRYFNTTGPCLPTRHYMLAAQERLPLAHELVEEGRYFVVHAPRQTGKTTALASMAHDLTASGEYVALRFSCETAEVTGDDYEQAELLILGAIRRAAEWAGLPDELAPPNPWPDDVPGARLVRGLAEWARSCPRPLALFFDEIDALQGESLRSVLRQLRDGYTDGRDQFPHAVVLCGLRDVRDYKAASGGDPRRLGTSSPFNIKVASLRLGDFSEAEVRSLYGQHTAETGQEFTAEALERAFCYTQGQPWLVNALGYEIVRRMRVPQDTPITAEHVDEAKERLILARATHLDSLVARLGEDRVRRVIEPLIAGELPEEADTYADDMTYVRDLGLIAPNSPVRVANPIYKEVIVRVLGIRTESVVTDTPSSFRLPDGRIDLDKLLRSFAAFWRENGEILATTSTYPEAAAQLVMMAYLHRIVNGAGFIDREYGVGRRRIDLLIRQPYTEADGSRAVQRAALELKVWREGRIDPLADGLAQLDDYLDRTELPTGTLVVFDTRSQAAPVHERTAFSEATTPSGRTVTLLRA